MDVHLSRALGAVRLALGDTAQKATKRRLTMLKDVPCKINCTGCCSRPIMISMAEATIVYEYLVAKGTWPDVRERSKSQFRISQETSPLSWFKMNVKCPVLDMKDGQCLAYPVRPAVCSTHFVTSDSAGCDPWETKNVEYEPVDMADLYADFQKKLESGVAAHGIMSMQTQVPVALLIAERIRVKTSLSIPEVISLIYNECK